MLKSILRVLSDLSIPESPWLGARQVLLSLCFQYRPHLVRQILDRERLLNVAHTFIQHAMGGNNVGRIAGHI